MASSTVEPVHGAMISCVSISNAASDTQHKAIAFGPGPSEALLTCYMTFNVLNEVSSRQSGVCTLIILSFVGGHHSGWLASRPASVCLESVWNLSQVRVLQASLEQGWLRTTAQADYQVLDLQIRAAQASEICSDEGFRLSEAMKDVHRADEEQWAMASRRQCLRLSGRRHYKSRLRDLVPTGKILGNKLL